MTNACPSRDPAVRVQYALVVLVGGVLLVYFALVPVIGLNDALHFYLMLRITMAAAFNVSSGFSDYLPQGQPARGEALWRRP